MKMLATVCAVCTLGLSLLSGCSSITSMLPAKEVSQAKKLVALQASINARTLWQVKTGSNSGKDYVRLHPYVDEQAVIVAGGGVVAAWDKTSGQALWKVPVKEEITGGVNGGDGLVFIGTSDGHAVALDSQTGKERWIEQLNSEILSVSSPANGKVVFRTSDGKLNGLSLETGELVWQQIRATPPLSLRGAGVPIVVGSMVIAGFDNGTVTAFDMQDGTGLWEAILSVPRGRNDLDRITDVDGRIKPVGSALFAASYDGQIAGIKMQDGTIGWSMPFSTLGGVEADQGGVYAANETGDILKLDPQSGRELWKNEDLQGRSPTAPTRVGNYLVAGDSEGFLHWINPADGKIVARLRSDDSGYTVPPVSDGPLVYTFGKSGVLAAHTVQ